MQPKSPQVRTYSFHFNRLTPTNTPSSLIPTKDSINTTNTAKNASINFMYQSQGQQVQSNNFPRNQPAKPSLHKEKSCELMKRYTFSLILNQAQQPKSHQNHEHLYVKTSQTKNRQKVMESEMQKEKMTNQQNYSFKLASKNSGVIPVADNSNTLEMIRQRQAKQFLQRELKNHTKQNHLLKTQIKELENQLLQKDEQIQELNSQLEELKRITKENEPSSLVNSAKSKARDSAISTLQIQESEHSFQKEVKEWSNSTIIYNYEQEYRQILAIFEVQLNQQNYHDHLLSQIDKLLKKVEQANRSLILSKQRQKQIYRLTSLIKKLQGQNIHLVNAIPFLHKQIAKNNDLLQQANREIQIFNIKLLNEKYTMCK